METVKTKELAEVLGLSRKGVIEKARKDGWAFVYRGNSMLFVENRLPADVRFAVALYRSGKPVPVQKEEKKDARLYSGDAFLNAGEKAQGEATWRAALIREYNNSGMNVAAFMEVYNGCNAFPVLREKLGEVSQATFYRWIKAFKENGASGIVPKYGMSRGGAGESLLDEERELLRRFWLKDTQPSAMHAFRLMKANIPYSKCSYQTALRYLNSLPKATAGYFRGGEGRFENAFLPHMEQDITRFTVVSLSALGLLLSRICEAVRFWAGVLVLSLQVFQSLWLITCAVCVMVFLFVCFLITVKITTQNGSTEKLRL